MKRILRILSEHFSDGVCVCNRCTSAAVMCMSCVTDRTYPLLEAGMDPAAPSCTGSPCPAVACRTEPPHKWAWAGSHRHRTSSLEGNRWRAEGDVGVAGLYFQIIFHFYMIFSSFPEFVRSFSVLLLFENVKMFHFSFVSIHFDVKFSHF